MDGKHKKEETKGKEMKNSKGTWKCNRKRKENKNINGGYTTNWEVVKKYIPTLSLLFDATGGLVPHKTALIAAFTKWLNDQTLVWDSLDIERTMYSLKVNPRSSFSLFFCICL